VTIPAFAASPRERRASAAPRRACFVYLANGVRLSHWRPKEADAASPPETLAPLFEFQSGVRVFRGLRLDGALAHGDGPGDHARASAAFLTCAHPKKRAPEGLKVGVSVDQVIAEKVGASTRLRSLDVGCEPGRPSGDCDSGYPCAYTNNVSWRTPFSPTGKETSPRAVFDRLFGTEEDRAPQRRATRRRILDSVREDAKRLSGALGAGDRARLDEYLTAVDALDARIAREEADGAAKTEAKAPGDAKDYATRLRLHYDLMATAFAADLTRVATFQPSNEGSNRPYRDLDVAEGHHDLSHHGGDREKLDKLARIDAFHVKEFARFVETLANAKEDGGSILDRSIVLLGSGIADGDRHDHADLPVLLCGGLGPGVGRGPVFRAKDGTPLADLHLSILDAMHVRVASFADSSGRL
jgi:hypothetical protein